MHLKESRQGWDFENDGKQSPEESQKKSNESKLIKFSIIPKNGESKGGANFRKNTLIEQLHHSIKQASPQNFPKINAAFKPFKKRANSLHVSPQMPIRLNGAEGEALKKREEKASRKEEEELVN